MFSFVNETSCTSVKFAFKIVTVVVELKSYSNVVVKTSSVETSLSNMNKKAVFYCSLTILVILSTQRGCSPES